MRFIFSLLFFSSILVFPGVVLAQEGEGPGEGIVSPEFFESIIDEIPRYFEGMELSPSEIFKKLSSTWNGINNWLEDNAGTNISEIAKIFGNLLIWTFDLTKTIIEYLLSRL